MKIAVLMGSPRKKDSYAVCRLLEGFLSKNSDNSVEYIFLKEHHVEDCRGCDQCFQKSEHSCPCKDDIQVIKEKLLAADGIIFVSPVYACQITGLMKRTLDRLSYLFHRQEFVGKPALTIVTTGGGGIKPVSNYLKMTACGWGCRLIGRIELVSPMFFENSKNKTAWGYREAYYKEKLQHIKTVAQKFEKAVRSKSLPVPSFYDIFMFQCLRSKTFVSKADRNFWESRGWLDSNYFYRVKLNPAKQIFSNLIRVYVNSAGKKLLAK